MISANMTEIQSIVTPNRTAEADARVPRRPEAEDKKAVEGEKPAVRVDAQPPPAGLADIDAMKEKRNAVAMTVRQVDTTMDAIDENITQMKDQLLQIVKQYPPFPPDSQDRMNILRNFGQMRRLIERLSFPPVVGDESANNSARMEASMETAAAAADAHRAFLEESQQGAGGHE